MSLRATNLNLLPILQALLRTQSVSRASTELGLSQPATSHALTRLRALFGDPLLVKVGRTMRPTRRAEALMIEVDAICAAIGTLLAQEIFAPESSRRTFVIGTPDYMALLLGPPLVALLEKVAPEMAVRFTAVGSDLADQLETGDIDIAIIANIEALTRSFSILDGYRDHLIGVVAADHPFAHSPPENEADMAPYRHISIEQTTPLALSNDIARRVSSGTSPVRISASQMLILPLMVAHSQHYTIVPQVLAERAAAMAPIALFALPDGPVPMPLCQIWSPLADTDAAHLWLRMQIDTIMRDIFQTDDRAAGSMGTRQSISMN